MLEMDYTYNDDGTIEDLVFMGLDGAEKVSTIREALALLRVSNPLDDYQKQLQEGDAPPMASGEYNTLLKSLCFLDELWWSTGEKSSRLPSMNVLMLLAKALERLLNNYVRTERMKEDYQKEIRQWLETAAMLGDAQAQKHYADQLHTGSNGFTPNLEKAAQFMIKAAERGDAEAQNFMGKYYADGLGVTQDYKKAREWFERAAEQGNDSAYFNLGLLYDEGKGVEQNDRKAHDCYLKAYKLSSHEKAACNLGYLYLHGRGVPKDEKKGFRYFMSSALGGYKPAILTLVDLCERGIGTPQGKPHLRWARKWRAEAEKK